MAEYKNHYLKNLSKEEIDVYEKIIPLRELVIEIFVEY